MEGLAPKKTIDAGSLKWRLTREEIDGDSATAKKKITQKGSATTSIAAAAPGQGKEHPGRAWCAAPPAARRVRGARPRTAPRTRCQSVQDHQVPQSTRPAGCCERGTRAWGSQSVCGRLADAQAQQGGSRAYPWENCSEPSPPKFSQLRMHAKTWRARALSDFCCRKL